MRLRKYLLIGVAAAVALFATLNLSAYAFGKSRFSAPKPHYKVKKNDGPFGGKYLAPKKQRRPTGYYRSTLTGKTVYGKPPR